MPSDINPSGDNNLVSPQILIDKLIALEEQLPPLLDEYNTANIAYQNNVGNSQYQQPYNTALTNLNQLNSGLFMLGNLVESNSDDLQTTLDAINLKIDKAQKTNTELKKKLNLYESSIFASTEMIINYKQLYTGSYLKNWSLLLSIVLAGVAIKIVFTNKVGILNNKP